MALYNTTTKQEFDEKVLQSDKLVLVDFWAAWCMPCQAMAPVLHKLADEMDKDIDIIKVNIEETQDNAQIAGEYRVQSIPNMHVFKGGEQVDQIIGLVPAPVLKSTLQKYL